MCVKKKRERDIIGKIQSVGEKRHNHNREKTSGIINSSGSNSRSLQVEEINGPRGWVQWCSACRGSRREVGVATQSGSLPPSASGPGAAVVGCLVGVYPCSQTSAGPRGPTSAHLIQGIPTNQQLQGTSCRACCCSHISNHHQQPPPAVQLTSQRGGLSLRVARVASTTSVRAAPYAHPQHQGLGPECR